LRHRPLWLTSCAEEFGIYLNYVRKLGFEETPDYDFLRELFLKVMKNNGDVEDGVYDWNLLNGRNSVWSQCALLIQLVFCRGQRLGSFCCQHTFCSEAPPVLTFPQGGSSQPAPPPAALSPTQQRPRGEERRRSQGGAVVPPSPALVRNGSARRKIPTGLAPGQMTPASGAAHVGVPPPSSAGGVDRRGSQQRLSANHPFASMQGSYEYTDGVPAAGMEGQAAYGRASPMVSPSGAAAPAVSDVRATGDAARQRDQAEPEQPSAFWKILTCRCG
jgi:casein kinase 1